MRVLIYHRENYLMPIGGPSGYLFNLQKGLRTVANKDIYIDFLPSDLDGVRADAKRQAKISKNPIVKLILDAYRRRKKIKSINTILTKTVLPIVDLNRYDIIHFHTTRDFYLLRDALKEYKGKTILTSHSPQPLSNEYIDSLTPSMKRSIGGRLDQLIDMDRYAFKNVDYIFFPCESADEPYEHEWKEYSEIKVERNARYKYILTGTSVSTAKTPVKEVRERYGIPQEAFVISYIGRHNEIKGYDRLKRIAKQFMERNKDVYVLVAGSEAPIKRLEHPNWIEVGWTNDPHSIVYASDVFVLPNRETYFDLVMLEVLSLGKYSLISYTGGNKYFERFKGIGIQFFVDENEAVEKLEQIFRMPREERKKFEENNRVLYNDNFTNEIFAQRYIELLKGIRDEK